MRAQAASAPGVAEEQANERLHAPALAVELATAVGRDCARVLVPEHEHAAVIVGLLGTSGHVSHQTVLTVLAHVTVGLLCALGAAQAGGLARCRYGVWAHWLLLPALPAEQHTVMCVFWQHTHAWNAADHARQSRTRAS